MFNLELSTEAEENRGHRVQKRKQAISKRSRQLQRVLRIAQEEDVIVRTRDGEQFFVSLVDDFAQEVAQQRRNKKLMTFLEERFRAARSEKGTPLDDVEQRLVPKKGRSKHGKSTPRKQ